VGRHPASGLLPGTQSAEEACDIFESLRLQIEHRTGARVFGPSRAIRDDQLVFRQLANTGGELRQGQ
jgi:hypothetical protein